MTATAEPQRAGAERGLAQVGSGPKTSPVVWSGLGLLALVAVGAISFSSASSRSARPAREGRPVVRTNAPVLDSGPPSPAAEETVDEPCLDPTKVAALDSPPEPAPIPAVSEVSAGLLAEMQRQALEAAQRKRELEERRRRSSMVALDRKVERSVRTADPGEAAFAAAASRADLGPKVPWSQGPFDRSSKGADLGALLRNGGEIPADGDISREERFARRAALEPVETVRAERLEHPETVVPQGTLIRGVLETAIQSDLPGFARAQVSEPVYSFTGQLVVPRGSTLIGRYQSGLVQGQTRVFVIWQRLLRPDGVSIQLASPGTDLLGRAGVTGAVNTRFFERFRGSLLLSLVDGGLSIAAAKAQNSDGSTIVNAGGQEIQRAAELALQNSVNIPPTIDVPRGTPVQVFVAKDLDFGLPIRREAPEGAGE